MPDKTKVRSRDFLDDPETFAISNWRLHNDGADNSPPVEELANVEKFGPSLMDAVDKVFADIENPSQKAEDEKAKT